MFLQFGGCFLLVTKTMKTFKYGLSYYKGSRNQTLGSYCDNSGLHIWLLIPWIAAVLTCARSRVASWLWQKCSSGWTQQAVFWESGAEPNP